MRRKLKRPDEMPTRVRMDGAPVTTKVGGERVWLRGKSRPSEGARAGCRVAIEWLQSSTSSLRREGR